METAGGGGGDRLDSQNLRDFLRVKQEEHQNNLTRRASGRNNFSNLTLNAVLSDKRGQVRQTEELERVQSNRTLLDIIREESGGGAYRDGRRSWQHFKDKIRLRGNGSGSGSGWTSSVRVPASDIPISNNNNDRNRHSFTQFGDSSESTQPNVRPSLERVSSRAMERVSGGFEHTSSLAMGRSQREHDNDDEEDEVEREVAESEEEGGSGEGEGGEGQQPVRTSLMALLAQTDRQMGLDGLGYMLDDDDDEDEEEVVESGCGLEYNNCCVCMVRHKGAAFIPCGHTFCRLCSRELYAQRGNCPLCNNYILEILDIF